LAIKSCKGPGKSFALAVAIFWWLFTRWHANVAVMSITEDNLKQNLWRELSLVYRRSWALQQAFHMSSEQITAKKYELSWFAKRRSFPQNADKKQQDNVIAGLHGRHPAVFCDEAGSYPDGVVVAAEAIFNTLTDGKPVDARLAIAGNPTSTEGPLYRVCTRDREHWWVKEITGDPRDPHRAKRIDPVEAQRQIDLWGEDHDFVRVNILGRFPRTQSNKLLGPEDVAEAAGREPDPSYLQDPVVMGLDVARYGDDESVLFRRQGRMAFRPLVWRETDLMTLADQVCNEVTLRRPGALFVDQTGVGGGVVDRLRQLGVNVVTVDFGGTPIDAERFLNRRSEMWWRMADWVKNGGCIPDDMVLRDELVSPIFEFREVGKATKFVLESKKDMRARGVGSTNRADGLGLTFASPVYVTPSVMQVTDDAYRPVRAKIIGGTEEGDWNPLED
jgi:phage terminase large subunit